MNSAPRMFRSDRSCSRQRAFAFPALSPAAFARAPHRLLFQLDSWGCLYSPHPGLYRRTVLSRESAFAQNLHCSYGHLMEVSRFAQFWRVGRFDMRCMPCRLRVIAYHRARRLAPTRWLVADVWPRGPRLRLRPLPNGLHSVCKGPDDRSQPRVSDVDTPVLH